MSIFILTFAIAKLVKNIVFAMKKISFLAFFLLTALFSTAQVVDSKLNRPTEGVMVMMETTEGPIVLKLYDETPVHRDNFVKLVESGVYNGLLFHRVIEKFMIQAGDPKSRDAEPGILLGEGSLGYTITAEFVPHLFHKRGALCAARQGDDINPKKESSASQFYIVQGTTFSREQLERIGEHFGKKFTPEQIEVYNTLGGAPHLDGDYTVFGEVLEGMEVVDRIAAAERDGNDRPVKDIVILKAYVIK